MALAGEQTRRRVQPDPAGPGDVDLGPGVQIGDIGRHPGRAVQRFDVGGQLDRVSRHEPGRQAQLAQDGHQEPGHVPAGSDAGAQREVRGLDAGFHPEAVPDGGVHRLVERHQEVDGPGAGDDREVAHPLLMGGPYFGRP